MNPEKFWSPLEHEIKNFRQLERYLNTIHTKWSSKKHAFAWRGQVDSSWALHSSLYRRLSWSRADPRPEEADLYKAESRVLADVHRWGLHVSPDVGRLSILNQLAKLQHYGAPTRLIDITFNPWIAAWFAVEVKSENGIDRFEDRDARLFAIDVTERLINETRSRRSWEDDLHRPWPKTQGKPASVRSAELKTWCTRTFAWKPPHLDARISAQNGGFVFGGVPSSSGPKGPIQWPKYPGAGRWTIDEVRASTSVPLRPHRLTDDDRGVEQNAVYTARISAKAKTEIRERLEKSFGYQHKTIYPDFTGFASFGTPQLRTLPKPAVKT
jgi:hypothetical protein